jgi:outer membrane immunogenic protein
MLKKAIAAVAALLATTTVGSAADLPAKVLAPAPIWSWTGFYGGVHVGAGWGTTESTLTGASAPGLGAVAFTFPFSQNSRSGFLGGVQAGYNWQSGWAVFGVQGDFAGADINGTAPCVVFLSCTTQSDWLATVSGRIGAVVLDRGLIYAKGGVAWLNSTHSVSAPALLGGGGGLTQITSAESTAWGWLVGLGTEWMITRNWTAFIEYNYIEFDTRNEAFNIAFAGVPAFTINADLKNKLSVAKVGVNYKFDWGAPVAARY